MARSYIIGIDEVGRGPLAGPVVVAAVAVPAGKRLRAKALGPLRDSKKLPEQKREAWAAYAKTQPGLTVAVAKVQPRAIERLNISRAADRAAGRAYKALLKKQPALRRARCRVVLDGGLYLGDQRATASPRHAAQTIIKGDEKVPAIALASIVAKVHRDRLMKRLARRYPEYGFDQHKGYGTRQHLEALARFGASDAHRLTFLEKSFTLEELNKR